MNNESNNNENNLDNEDLIINNEKQNEIDYGANTVKHDAIRATWLSAIRGFFFEIEKLLP